MTSTSGVLASVPRVGDTRPGPMPARDVTSVEVVRIKAVGEAWQHLRGEQIVLGVDPAGRMVEWRSCFPVAIGDRFTVTIEPQRRPGGQG